MSDQFRQWLTEELKGRNYNQSSLAATVGVTQSFVSKVLSGDKAPGFDFCIKVATAFDVSPVMVLTIAGILPPQPPGAPDDDPALTELTDLARRLPPDDLQEIIALIRFKLSRR